MQLPAKITMELPANTRFVATARLTTTSLAAELEFNIDAIEDIRVGVNELVSVVLEWAEDHGDPEIEIAWTLYDESLEVAAGVPGATEASSETALDMLTEQILASVVDTYEVGAGWGRIMKKRHVA